MYLFSRQAALRGPIGDVMSWASEIRGHAADTLGTEIALWSTVFGGPVGSVAWAMRVDGLADVAAIGQKLLADEKYHALLAKGAEYYVAPAEDTLMQPVHGELGEASPPVGAVATITTATMTGSVSAAVGWGVEVAQLVERVTGTPVLFGTSSYSDFMQVAWIGVSADAAAADASNAKVQASAEYMGMVDGATKHFLPGSANRALVSRVA